jgi:protein-disulfide isomerase
MRLRRPITKVLALASLGVVALLGTVRPGLTQSPPNDSKALGKEIESLKTGQQQIQKDLEEIKNLLRARPAAPAGPAAPAEPDPASLVVNLDKQAPFKGSKDAKLTLVDFTDYQ